VGDLLQTDPQERAKTTTASSDCRPRPTVPDPRSACAHTPKSYARQAPVLGLGRLLDGPSSPPRGGELVRLFPAAVLVESRGVRLDLGVSEQPHRCADGVLLRAVGTRVPQGGANGGAVLASATGSASATGKPQCARRTAHAPAAPSGPELIVKVLTKTKNLASYLLLSGGGVCSKIRNFRYLGCAR